MSNLRFDGFILDNASIFLSGSLKTSDLINYNQVAGFGGLESPPYNKAAWATSCPPYGYSLLIGLIT